MLNFIIEIWDRIVNNWHTSVVAIVAGGIVVTKWFGIFVTAEEVILVMAAVEAVILLFAKD